MGVGVVLVHGGCHGPWCWSKVVAHLEESGLDLTVATPDLLAGPRPPTDPAVVQEEVNQLSSNGPVIVCGHSFAGRILSELAPSTVAHLVYIAAPLLDRDVWYRGPYLKEEFAAVTAIADGTFRIRPAFAREALYADCDDADVADAISRLRPQRISDVPATVERPAWRETPTTYVCCDDDNAVEHAYMLAAIAHVGNGVRWPTSHSPMISRPDLVAELLVSTCMPWT